MKSLLYLLPFSLFLFSCGAFKINKVTSDSSRFERFYEAAKKNIGTDEGSKKTSSGTFILQKDFLTFVLNAKDGTKGFYVIGPRFQHAAEEDSTGMLQNIPPEGVDSITYAKFVSVYAELQWYVLSEKDLNQAIQKKEEVKFNMWKELFSLKCGTQ